MNPNPKIESYLDCGHELVCKPRASTTAGPTDGAARDSVARGAGGRTCRGASARHHRRARGVSSGGRRSRAGPAPHRASGSGRRWLAPRPHKDARVLLGLLAPTPRQQAGPAHEARRRRLTARARRTRTRPAAAGPRGGGLRAALGGARPARSARGSWRCRRPDRQRMLPGPRFKQRRPAPPAHEPRTDGPLGRWWPSRHGATHEGRGTAHARAATLDLEAMRRLAAAVT